MCSILTLYVILYDWQVDVAKQAYEQAEALEEEEEQSQLKLGEEAVDDDFKTRSRDVGHNIYILAHQVW